MLRPAPRSQGERRWRQVVSLGPKGSDANDWMKASNSPEDIVLSRLKIKGVVRTVDLVNNVSLLAWGTKRSSLQLRARGFYLYYSFCEVPGSWSFGSGTPGPLPQAGDPEVPSTVLWDPRIDHEPVPTCIHYFIEWKLQLRKGRLSTLTEIAEENLTLAPSAYWDRFLRQFPVSSLALGDRASAAAARRCRNGRNREPRSAVV